MLLHHAGDDDDDVGDCDCDCDGRSWSYFRRFAGFELSKLGRVIRMMNWARIVLIIVAGRDFGRGARGPLVSAA